MKKELIARNQAFGMTIIQRFIDGERYYKFKPAHIAPMVMDKIKEQFKDKPIKMEEANGWLKIVKLGEDEELAKASEGALKKEGIDKENIDATYVLNKEAEMLKSQGFIVEIKDLE